MSITNHQRFVIVTLERVGGALSIGSVLVIFATFAYMKRLRTVPNTFIVFASVANLFASIACLIGDQGLTTGKDGSLCQAQAFLVEMFMQSDPWWSFAMAVNVCLVFFRGVNPNSFMKYLWLYCLICYGGPGLAATLCAALEGGEIYGDATLWCWIVDEYKYARMSSYVPVWFCIIFSILIYIAVGFRVFRQRNKLKNLTLTDPTKEESCNTKERESGEKDLKDSQEYYGTIVTEIQVVTSSINPPVRPPPATVSAPSRNANWPIPDSPSKLIDRHDLELGGDPSAGPFQSYSSVASGNKKSPRRSIKVYMGDFRARCASKLTKVDPVKMAYLRTSVIFAFSILVTWTPSTVLRMHGLLYGGKFIFSLNCAAAVVLPLQGVWNAFIFFTTSWKIVREEWAVLRARWVARRYDCIARERRGAGRVGIAGGTDKRHIRIQRFDSGSSEIELTGRSQLPVPGNSVNTIRVMKGTFQG